MLEIAWHNVVSSRRTRKTRVYRILN